MDFMVARRAGEAFPEWGRLPDWPGLSPVDGAIQEVRLGSFLIVAPSISRNRGRFQFFDGHAIAGGRAYSAAVGATPAPADSITLEGTAAGVFALADIDFVSGRLKVSLDPLSQYNLFTANVGGVQVVATNVYMIEALLKRMGLSLTRTFRVAGFEAALGMGAGVHTGFGEVSLFPADCRLEADMLADTWNVVRTGRLSRFLAARDVTAGEVAESLSADMAVLSRAFDGATILHDLTGGLDSRLVLAASRHAGLRHQAINRSPEGSPADIIIPDMIAALLGLNHMAWPGNHQGEELDAAEGQRRNIFCGQGHYLGSMADLGSCRLTGIVHVRGGLGEVGRSFYRPAPPLRGVPALLPWRKGYAARVSRLLMERRLKHEAMFSSAFKAEARQSLQSQLVNLQENGIGRENLLDALYLTDRCRRHFGFPSQMLNRSRPAFEPLARPDLLALAASYEASARAAGDAIHDLLGRLDPVLRDMPIDPASVRWSKRPYLRFTGDGTLPTPSVQHFSPNGTVRLTGRDAAPREDFMGRARDLRADHMIWDVLDRRTLLAEKDLPESRAFFSLLLNGLMWVENETAVSVIDRHVAVSPMPQTPIDSFPSATMIAATDSGLAGAG